MTHTRIHRWGQLYVHNLQEVVPEEETFVPTPQNQNNSRSLRINSSQKLEEGTIGQKPLSQALFHRAGWTPSSITDLIVLWAFILRTRKLLEALSRCGAPGTYRRGHTRPQRSDKTALKNNIEASCNLYTHTTPTEISCTTTPQGWCWCMSLHLALSLSWESKIKLYSLHFLLFVNSFTTHTTDHPNKY